MNELLHHRGACWCALFALACGSAPEAPPSGELLPEPERGFQMETPVFSVDPGQEVQDCYFFEVPGDGPQWVTRVELAMTDGSHHMNVFRVKTVKALDGAPGSVVRGGECWKSANWADWPLVINTQNDGIDAWQLPEGVGLRLEPGEKLMLQTHYVNVSSQKTPGDAKVQVNFHTLPEGSVDHELGTAFATNQNIRVCPGETRAFYEASCNFGHQNPITIIGANGHFHSRGKRFTMSAWDSLNGKGAQFYESTSWDEPPFSKGLSVPVAAQGGISWSCEFAARADQCGDPDDDCCFTFGGFVDYQEHCNAFVYYYPRGATDRGCF